MKSVKEIRKFSPLEINYSNIREIPGAPDSFKIRDELGFRLFKSAWRIEKELPYSREYIVGQVNGEDGLWSNFPKFHGDIAGRWIVAETYIHSGKKSAPKHLKDVVYEVMESQNADGSFGLFQDDDVPLNMHKAYGNGWLLKAFSQYAKTFADKKVEKAAVVLGDYYIASLGHWAKSGLNEGFTDFYAVSPSCFFHALDGLMTLYRLSGKKRFLEVAGKFIPELLPFEEANHSHMYLTIRRGVHEYFSQRGDAEALKNLEKEIEVVREEEILETGGVPECFKPEEGKVPDDEGCSLFDWEILCLKLYASSGEGQWLEDAILNLENQIFYNQTYNGGFGSFSLGDKYKQQGKEAPWCCSLFGPYGLIESTAMLVKKDKNSLIVNHLISGTFTFGKSKVRTQRDDKKRKFTISFDDAAKSFKKLKIYVPHWLSFADGKNIKKEGDFVVVKVSGEKKISLDFEYKLWVSNSGKAPAWFKTVADDTNYSLFFGPWVIAHRYAAPQKVNVKPDDNGFITEFNSEYLSGLNYYGEGFRIKVPSQTEFDPQDVFGGVKEKSGELYLYPLKDKESPDHANLKVCF